MVQLRNTDRVIALRDSRDALRISDQWEDLAAAAIEPNVFYEPWMLIPALEYLASNHVTLAAVFGGKYQGSNESSQLIGLFPVETRYSYRGLPLGFQTLWKHSQCFCCTPLIRAGCEENALVSFFEWVRQSRLPASFVEFKHVRGDGPFWELLSGFLRKKRLKSYETDQFDRALFRPQRDADTYLKAVLSGHHRHEYQRLERRLSEKGTLEIRPLRADESIETWIEQFLQLESSGWKGKVGTALACDEKERKYFSEIIRSAQRKRKVLILVALLDNRLIASKIRFLSGGEGFAFKTAFNEALRGYSPGALLELELIKISHSQTETQLVDSCAAPNHSLLNYLWPSRRSIRTVNVSTGKLVGDLLIISEPIAKRVYKRFLRRK